MNMLLGLSWLISSLTRVMILAGEWSSAAVDLIMVLVTAMNRAAGTPLPETSPTQMHSLFLSTKK